MKLIKFLVTFLCCNIFVPTILFAQWTCSSIDAVQIVGENFNQSNSQLIKSNGSQTIVGWQDKRSGTNENVFLQCINQSGLTDWQLNGIRVSVSEGQQTSTRAIATDSTIILVWQDNRSGVDYDIYAQQIDKNGQLMWANSGKVVCNATGNQYNPRMTSDGQGGAIIVWQDRRNNTDYNLYAQRINSNGQPQWTSNGIVVCSSSYDQFNLQIISDGSDGAIVAWHDFRAGTGYTDIYVQRISSNGGMIWQTNGVLVCNAPNNQANLQIIPDGFKGAIIVWQDRRTTGREDIFAQKINSSGSALWTANGVPISTANGYKYYPQLASDRTGGAIITWQDNRTGTDYNIYAQHVSFEGDIIWDTNGITVCSAEGQQYYPQITTDETGNAIIVWQDKRNNRDYDIYSQRVKIDGSLDWSLNGVIVTNTLFDQLEPQVLSDNEGGAIISWSDYRTGTGYSDIYANRIGLNGKMGGGCFRSFIQEDYSVKGERIKRPYYIPVPMPNAGNVRDTIFKRLFYPNGLVLGIAKTDSPRVFGWIRIKRGYNARKFFLQTGKARPFDFRSSTSTVRYFIKELRNPTPRRYDNHLAGELLTLKMNVYASDLGITNPGLGELIYHDTTYGNILHGKSLREIIGFTDSALTKWRTFSKFVNYSVVDSGLTRINLAFKDAIDTISVSPLVLTNTKSVFSAPFFRLSSSSQPQLNINVSNYGEEEPEGFSLFQNYPNPFNPSTSIEFDLPEASTVTLKIYNTLGAEVATLLNMEEMDEGRTEITFEADGLASGVYFYKLLLNNGEYQQTRKMLLLK
jgi:hypothetical protein